MRRKLIVRCISFAALAVCGTAQPVSPKLVYSTYLGEGPNVTFRALAVDSAGFAYIAGNGLAPDGISDCAFISQLDQPGGRLVWNVCLPLAEVDGLAVDRQGAVYLVGLNTPSSKGPSTVMKLAPVTHEAIYSTSIPGANGRLALDGGGDVYVFGLASADFQSTPGAFSSDAKDAGFVEKLDPSGQVAYATRLNFDNVGSIAVDSQGQAWAVGEVCARGDCRHYGYARAIRKLDASGATLLVSQSYGGGFNANLDPLSDSARSVAVDSTDAVWIVGGDQNGSVPITSNAVESSRPLAPVAGYAVKLSPSGELVYGSYIGARSQNPIASVALDSAGEPFFISIGALASSTILALSSDGSSVIVSKGFGTAVGTIGLDGNGGVYAAGSPSFSVRICPTTVGSYKPLTGPGNTIICTARFELEQLSDSQVFVPLNGASQQARSMTPGEVITIRGVNLPLAANVSFDGIPAPVVASSANAITAVVPFGINGDRTSLVVKDVGAFTLNVSRADPALFTADCTGAGQLDARNADSSINAPDNPAAAGDLVTVLMTGAGMMDPPIPDGALGPIDPPFPAPLLPVFVTVNGVAANVARAVQAAGKIAGIVQVDFQLPAGTVAGDAVVKISSDPANFPFQRRTTITVR